MRPRLPSHFHEREVCKRPVMHPGYPPSCAKPTQGNLHQEPLSRGPVFRLTPRSEIPVQEAYTHPG